MDLMRFGIHQLLTVFDEVENIESDCRLPSVGFTGSLPVQSQCQ
jgi:hypothetical protein